MGFDERLFSWGHRGLTRLWRRQRARPGRIDTERFLPRLRVLASAAAGRDLELSVVESRGGISGDTILLPASIDTLGTAAENERLLFVRAILCGAVVRARDAQQKPASKAELLSLAEATLRDELPGWARWLDALPVDTTRELLVGDLWTSTASGVATAALDTTTAGSERISERQARRRRPPLRKRELPDAERENPLTHSFEKVHTLEDYQGGQKPVDGADEIDAHAEALDELNLEEVVTSREPARSVYSAEAGALGEEADTERAESALTYDEWDPRKRRYLPGYCALRVEVPNSDSDAGAALSADVRGNERRVIAELRELLLRLDSERRAHTRQPDGPDVDIDALVARAAALRSGHDESDRLYISKRRRGHSLAVLLLVDGSLSTDSWVDNQRVLELERRAAAILTLAWDELIDEFALASFCSFSHSDCRFTMLRDFREPIEVGLGRLASLEPRGYTRLGPALRHGLHLLEARRAERRVLLLLSDGKPTDLDRYEGRHGIGDVRQAIREAEQRAVDVFALSVDPRSAPLLPRMFGSRGFAGLANSRDLARAMGGLVAKLSK